MLNRRRVANRIVLLLLGNEVLIRTTVIRMAILFVIFLSTIWLLYFAVIALGEPTISTRT